MKKLLTLVVALSLFFNVFSQVEYPGSVTVGASQIIFDYSTSNCNTIDIPDIPARAFRDANGNVNLFASHYTTWRMTGSNFNTLTKDCNPVMTSNADSDPSTFNNNEWISSTYTFDGNTIYALIHNEYVPCGNWQNCWYNSITSATSTDGGASFTQSTAPSHLVAASPYQSPYPTTHAPFGIFGGSNIIEKDGYYYKMVQLEAYQLQDWGAGLLRTDDVTDPTSWRGWDGTGFNVEFVNPYTATGYDPADKILAPVSRDNIGKMCASITYNTYFGKYMVVDYTVGEVNGTLKYGFYYALSDDLIHWSHKRLILQTTSSWGVGGSNYPSIIDHNDTSRNFENAGQTCYLYYTKWNSGTYDRDLVRIPLTFSKQTVNSFIVNSTNDGGDATPGDGLCKTTGNVCTLRAAIEEANARPLYEGYDRTQIPIEFGISGTGIKTITPNNYLPEIMYPVEINGYTQTGGTENTNNFNQGLNTNLTLKLNGVNAGGDVLIFKSGNNLVKGISLVNGGMQFYYEPGYSAFGDSNRVEGCYIGIAPDGTTLGEASITLSGNNHCVIGGKENAKRNLIAGTVYLINSNNDSILGNYFGTDKTGLASSGTSSHGIQITENSTNNIIGGLDILERNCISGANVGILLDGVQVQNNEIIGNYIGIGIDGTTDVGNQRAGITLMNDAGNTLIKNNVIVGNSTDEGGLWLDNSDNNIIQSNYIGTDENESLQLGNGDLGTYSGGIMILGASSGNTIGGANLDEANVIANNNFGISLNGAVESGNSIRINKIYNCSEMGIDLQGDYSVNQNDNLDVDSGPNDLMNFPVLTSANATSNQINIQGTLNSLPNRTFTIDFYANPSCNQSGNGEGKLFIGSTTLLTNSSGNATISSTFSATVTQGYYITSTATDDQGSTSEFSECLVVTTSSVPLVTVNSATICYGQSVTLTAIPSSNGGTYLWSNGSNNQSIIVNPNSTTTYSVVYTLNNVSSQVTYATVTVNSVPSISINNVTICSGSQATLTAIPNVSGGSYLWSDNSTNSSLTVSPNSNTSYSCVYTLNGCSSNSVNGIITVNPIPTITVNNAIICSGTSANLLASPNLAGGTYLWSPGNQTTSIISVTPNSTTTYSCVYTLNGCSSVSQSGTVTVNQSPTLSISASNDTICLGDYTTLTAIPQIGGGSYLWLPVSATTSSITVAPTETTEYKCIYSLNGCSSGEVSQIVTVLSPTASISGSTSVCSGGNVIVNITGTPNSLVTYTTGVSNQNITLDNSGNGTISFTNITSNVNISLINVTMNTPLSCTQNLSSNHDVNIVSTPTATISGTASICAGDSTDITITGTPNAVVIFNDNVGTNQNVTLNGNGMYSYNTGSISSNSTYTLVSVSNGCLVNLSDAVTVMINPLPIVNAGSDQEICQGNTVTLSGSGASTYSWNNGIFDSTPFIPLSTDTYTVIGTDANGCQSSDEVVVIVNPNPTANVTENLGVLSVGTFTAYQWYNSDGAIPNATNNTFQPSENGEYWVYVTNQFGCSAYSDTLNYQSNGVRSIVKEIVQIFPNPSNGKFVIEWNEMKNVDNVSIIDNKGNLVKLLPVLSEYDLTDLPKGMYIIEIKNDEEIIRQKLMIGL